MHPAEHPLIPGLPLRLCVDCGHELEREQRKDAKRCRRCSFLNTLSYAYVKFTGAKRCRGCGAKFRPMHSQQTTQCVDCHPRYGNTDPVTCVLCKHEHPAAYAGVPVCMYCASGPETQKHVVMALRRGQQKRQETPYEPSIPEGV